MAEIGIAASILSIAAIGTSLATTLHEQADVLVHAQHEIISMAKHVSRFTAVLKHMGQVLEAEKASCSEEMLRDIRRIKHSCRNTFKEINSTIRAKRSRFLNSFRWMFKRAKARELEARLESLQSMLQCMIHTLTVSKLGRMDSRSREDSGHISTLCMEIKLLKTFIVENYSNLEELRRAEHEYGARKTRSQSRDAYMNPENSTHRPLAQQREYRARTIHPSNAPLIPRSPGFHSDTESLEFDASDDEVSDQERKDPEDKLGFRRTDQGPNMNNVVQKQTPLPPPPPPYEGPSENSIHRESDLLLQMVPYRPASSDPLRPRFLLTGGQVQNSDGKSGMEEATASVRLLLDKWTNPGSAPISDLLAEEEANDSERKAELGHDEAGRAHQVPRHWSTPLRHHPLDGAPGGFRDYSPPLYPHVPRDESPLPRRGGHPVRRHPANLYHKEIWKGPSPGRILDQSFGEEMLRALRSAGAGIVYTKRFKFHQDHYVDAERFASCTLVPTELIPTDDSDPVCTELNQGLVRKEALDLLGYSYEATPSGQFAIAGNLDMAAIEELIKLSYQALNRTLKEQSKRSIEEKGWRQAVDSLDYAWQTGRPFREDDPWPTGEPFRDDSPLSYERRRPNRTRVPSPRRETIIIDRPRGRRKSELEALEREELIQRSRARVVDQDKEGLTSSATKKNGPGRRPPQAPEVPASIELELARQKLEQLRKRKAESEIAKDFQRAADLVNYAIPDQMDTIEALEKKVIEEQNVKFRRTEVETESESSDEDHAATANGVGGPTSNGRGT